MLEKDALNGLQGTSPPYEELWGLKVVQAKTGLSRSTIYAYIAEGTFPAQRRLGPRRVGWLSTDIAAWISSRPRLPCR